MMIIPLDPCGLFFGRIGGDASLKNTVLGGLTVRQKTYFSRPKLVL